MSESTGPEKGRLVAVEIDDGSLSETRSYFEGERETAIRDLLADNCFTPHGHTGEFGLRVSTFEKKLVLDVSAADGDTIVRHILSLRPLARVVRDYFTICESYEVAVKSAQHGRIEAIDMGRRGIHNDGAAIIMERLVDKIDLDHATARRLFTLVCALNWRDQHEP